MREGLANVNPTTVDEELICSRFALNGNIVFETAEKISRCIRLCFATTLQCDCALKGLQANLYQIRFLLKSDLRG